MLSICTRWLHALAIFHSRQLPLHFDRLGWLERSQSGYDDSSRLVTFLKVSDAPRESYYDDRNILLGPK